MKHDPELKQIEDSILESFEDLIREGICITSDNFNGTETWMFSEFCEENKNIFDEIMTTEEKCDLAAKVFNDNKESLQILYDQYN